MKPAAPSRDPARRCGLRDLVPLAVLLFTLAAARPAPAAGDTSPPGTTAAPAPASTADALYRSVLEQDDEAQEEVDRWIRDNSEFLKQGAGVTEQSLKARILQRMQPVREAYENLLRRQPSHVPSRIAYASFLKDIGEEAAALGQLERARDLDPKNPAVWNNLGTTHAALGQGRKSVESAARALELRPDEPAYARNLASAILAFRREASEHFHEPVHQSVLRAIDLYRRALRASPGDFVLAGELARAFYALDPAQTGEAITAWTQVLTLSTNDTQRQGVLIHLARWKDRAGRTAEAKADLAGVTLDPYQAVKAQLLKSFDSPAPPPGATNAPPATNPPPAATK